MTSKLTREQVIALITEHSYDSALVDALEYLLAAIDSEPVAYMYRDNLHSDARFSLESKIGNWSPEDINEYEITETPLYRHAQPALVVPDEKDKTVDADDHPLLWSFNEGWNACRAAMLAAAQQEGK
ncbi:hypothetical protein [Klebsiella pneumoniae]|uniref:hypothetical protein n=1 Tax=Klebsiella pneumoniae TaxID=573 RepID=UPI002FE5A6DD|nr:hypothetical protein [Klebsiella oxytoca]